MTHDLTRFQGSFPAVVTPFRDGKVDIKAFEAFLATMGYPYVEETQNPAYRLFLQAQC